MRRSRNRPAKSTTDQATSSSAVAECARHLTVSFASRGSSSVAAHPPRTCLSSQRHQAPCGRKCGRIEWRRFRREKRSTAIRINSPRVWTLHNLVLAPTDGCSRIDVQSFEAAIASPRELSARAFQRSRHFLLRRPRSARIVGPPIWRRHLDSSGSSEHPRRWLVTYSSKTRSVEDDVRSSLRAQTNTQHLLKGIFYGGAEGCHGLAHVLLGRHWSSHYVRCRPILGRDAVNPKDFRCLLCSGKSRSSRRRHRGELGHSIQALTQNATMAGKGREAVSKVSLWLSLSFFATGLLAYAGSDSSLDCTSTAFYNASMLTSSLPFQTMFSVCWGANAYGPGYDAANQTAYLDLMLRWGLDWSMNVSLPPPPPLAIADSDRHTRVRIPSSSRSGRSTLVKTTGVATKIYPNRDPRTPSTRLSESTPPPICAL